MDSEFFRPPGLERSRAWHSNKWKNKKEGKRNISADQIQRKGRLGLAAWPTNRKTYGLLSKEDGDPFLDEMISTRERERKKVLRHLQNIFLNFRYRLGEMRTRQYLRRLQHVHFRTRLN